jgi:hypothetical protein
MDKSLCSHSDTSSGSCWILSLRRSEGADFLEFFRKASRDSLEYFDESTVQETMGGCQSMRNHSSRHVAVTIFAGAVLLSAPCFATHPLGTEDPGTVPPLDLQVEVTGEYHHTTGADNEIDLGIALTTGLLSNLDLALGAGYTILAAEEGSTEKGFGDLELAAKWNFIEEKESLPGLALKVGVTLPTGDDEKGLGSGGYDTSANLIAGKAVGPVNLHLNLGYTRIVKAAEGEKKNVYSASLAGAWDIVESWAFVGEVLYESPGADGEDPPVAVTAGLVWEIADNFSIDVGARAGLTETAPDWCILAGVNYTFGGPSTEEKHEN